MLALLLCYGVPLDDCVGVCDKGVVFAFFSSQRKDDESNFSGDFSEESETIRDPMDFIAQLIHTQNTKFIKTTKNLTIEQHAFMVTNFLLSLTFPKFFSPQGKIFFYHQDFSFTLSFPLWLFLFFSTTFRVSQPTRPTVYNRLKNAHENGKSDDSLSGRFHEGKIYVSRLSNAVGNLCCKNIFICEF